MFSKSLCVHVHIESDIYIPRGCFQFPIPKGNTGTGKHFWGRYRNRRNHDGMYWDGGYPDSKVHGANMGPTWVLSDTGTACITFLHVLGTELSPFPDPDLLSSFHTCTSVQFAQGIDLKLGGYIHYGIPETSLTFGHASLNPHSFMALIGRAVSSHL